MIDIVSASATAALAAMRARELCMMCRIISGRKKKLKGSKERAQDGFAETIVMWKREDLRIVDIRATMYISHPILEVWLHRTKNGTVHEVRNQTLFPKSHGHLSRSI